MNAALIFHVANHRCLQKTPNSGNAKGWKCCVARARICRPTAKVTGRASSPMERKRLAVPLTAMLGDNQQLHEEPLCHAKHYTHGRIRQSLRKLTLTKVTNPRATTCYCSSYARRMSLPGYKRSSTHLELPLPMLGTRGRQRCARRMRWRLTPEFSGVQPRSG